MQRGSSAAARISPMAESDRVQARRRAGSGADSSSGGRAWQLVEVSREVASALSKPNTPSLQLLATPPASLPAMSPDLPYKEWEETKSEATAGRRGGLPARKSWWEQSGFADDTDEEGTVARRDTQDQASPGDDAWDPVYFVGDWVDNLGHDIMVSPSGPRWGGRRAGDRRKANRGGGNRRSWKSRDRDWDRESDVGSTKGSVGYLATLHKVGVPEKCFTIANDRGGGPTGTEWTCGNGSLLPAESTPDVLVWLAKDGRKSEWKRRPPEGPVYFDPPPAPTDMPAQEERYGIDNMGWYANDGGDGQGGDCQFFWAAIGEADGGHCTDASSQGGCCGAGAEGQLREEALQQGQQMCRTRSACSRRGGDASDASNWNPEAAAFYPTDGESRPPSIASPALMACEPPRQTATRSAASSAAPTPVMRPCSSAPSPMLKPWTSPKMTPSSGFMPPPRRSWGRTPTPSPKLGPVPSPKLGGVLISGRLPTALVAAPQAVPKQPIMIELPCGPSAAPGIKVEGDRLEWTLPVEWASLSKFPKEFCVTSPVFGVRRAPFMQLTFYPRGSRTSEEGQSAVMLTREKESAGIKFEILVNRRGVGPKVCLGRRYVGDCPPPPVANESAGALSHVVITMQILEILGE